MNRRTALTLLAALLLVALAAFPAAAAPGDLDPTFAGGGVRLIQFGANDSQAFDLVVMLDNGAVLAGRAFLPGGVEPALARVDRDGRLVKSFGVNGRMVEDGGGVADIFEAVARQGSKLLAVAVDSTNNTPTADFMVFRFNGNGTLDTSFGVGGVARTDFGGADRASDLVVLPDGRFVVVGRAIADGTATFGAARFTPGGAPDTTFGNNGRRRIAFPGAPSGGATAVALRPGGGVVIVGSMQDINVDAGAWAIAALTPSGGIDTSFSGDGRVRLPFGDNSDGATSVAVRQGKILVGGFVFGEDTAQDFALVRFQPDGALDPLYGEGGVAILPSGDEPDVPNGLAIASDGRAYLVGGTADGNELGILARVTPGGDPDPSFGDGGFVSFLYNEYAFGSAVGLDSAERAVVAGEGGVKGTPDMLAARFLT
ncbi:MAG TPA: hypothetical protein VEO00_01865 [Actinomycetota bacterium]|nr:hypothetical protein [Actinomycetota bacterium]